MLKSQASSLRPERLRQSKAGFMGAAGIRLLIGNMYALYFALSGLYEY
jgi:hypothetical protein